MTADHSDSRLALFQPRSGRKFVGYRIPTLGEGPSDDMVEWLSEGPADTWDGDDSGITVRRVSGESTWHEVGGPGDFIVWDEVLQTFRIVKAGAVGPGLEFQLTSL